MAAKKQYVLQKGNHKVTTTVPAEYHQLRAQGYTDAPRRESNPPAAKNDKK